MFNDFMNQWRQPNPLNSWFDQMGGTGATLGQAKDLNNFIRGDAMLPSSGQNFQNSMQGGQAGGFTLGGLTGDQLKLGLGGLQTLGNLWGSFQSNKLAKDQFKFTKDFANKNLANQTKTYNTSLTDRITSRASSNGLSEEQVAQYLKENRM